MMTARAKRLNAKCRCFAGHTASSMLVAIMLVASSRLSARAPAPGESTPVPVAQNSGSSDIVVTAETVRALDALVSSLTRTNDERQVARWDRSICPKILGLDTEQSALIASTIADDAKIAGLRTSGGHCRGNIVVVVTSDAAGFASALVQRYPRLFRDPSGGLAPRSERNAIARSDAPVRWIVASRTSGTGGSASRLLKNSVEQLNISISIVDATRLSGITFQQLSDYLALASLTHADMNASYGPNTILSLFQSHADGGKPPPGLTRVDKAFLRSLYGSNPLLAADAQRLNIRASIQRELHEPDPSDAGARPQE